MANSLAQLLLKIIEVHNFSVDYKAIVERWREFLSIVSI